MPSVVSLITNIAGIIHCERCRRLLERGERYVLFVDQGRDGLHCVPCFQEVFPPREKANS